MDKIIALCDETTKREVLVRYILLLHHITSSLFLNFNCLYHHQDQPPFNSDNLRTIIKLNYLFLYVLFFCCGLDQAKSQDEIVPTLKEKYSETNYFAMQ